MVAWFDALLMVGIAYGGTGASIDAILARPVLWGAALAAIVCAVVVVASGPAVLGWGAIGYILFGALLAPRAPDLLVAALALALMPLVPRPRGSLAAGLAVAVVVALGIPLAARVF